MANEGSDLQLTYVKRKLYYWLVTLLKDHNDALNDSQQWKHMVPDAKDIVGILRSTGFKLVDVAFDNSSFHASQNEPVCRVTVNCGRSGLSAVLESDGECRCPDKKQADSASMWCVSSPANKQDNLNNSANVAGSSLLPEASPNVAELVGSATRCLMRLLEDPSATGPGPRLSGGRRPAQRTSSAALGDRSCLGASLDDSSLSHSLSHSLSKALSLSESQLPQVGATAPPRRQSSTLEEYAAFKKTLCGEAEAEDTDIFAPPKGDGIVLEYPMTPVILSVVPPSPGRSSATIQAEVDSATGESYDKCIALLPQAQDVFQKAERAMRDMSEAVQMLKQLLSQGDTNDILATGATVATTQTPMGRAAALSRSSIPRAKAPPRSPSACSSSSSGSSTLSARTGSSTLTLQPAAEKSPRLLRRPLQAPATPVVRRTVARGLTPRPQQSPAPTARTPRPGPLLRRRPPPPPQ